MKLTVPVIGILRGFEQGFIKDIINVSFESGLQAVEVTFNTKNVLEIIENSRKNVKTGCFLGVGTVRNLNEAKEAFEAGAMFLVTPNLDLKVLEFANSKNLPVICGAATPTEIYQAWAGGAAMVKVFPCQALGGPGYIKDLRGPFDNIPLVAVGGVTPENLNDYFKAGVTAVGVSSSLFGKEALASQNLEILKENIKKYLLQIAKY